MINVIEAKQKKHSKPINRPYIQWMFSETFPWKPQCRLLCRGSCTFSPIRCPLDVSHLGWRRTMFFQVDPGSSTGHVMWPVTEYLSHCSYNPIAICDLFVVHVVCFFKRSIQLVQHLSIRFVSLQASSQTRSTPWTEQRFGRDETHHEGKYQVNCCLERLVKCCISLILCLRLILYLHISASHIHIQHILLAGKKRKHQNHWNIPPCRSSGQKESSKHVLFQATNRTRTKRSPQPRDLRKPIMLHSKD